MGSSYSVSQIPELTGKVAVVTGTSAGIGKECATELARKGCHVILACRSKSKTIPVVEKIQQETENEKVEWMELDLSSLKSVANFTKEYKEKGYPLHILLNNAAVMACPFALSEDGIELQFATNHLGHFLLTTQLLDVIVDSAPSRIVNVSSMAHKWAPEEGIRFDLLNDESTYGLWKAYGQSKLANILFTNELVKRLKDKPVYCNSLHPGAVNTELSRHFKENYGIFGSALVAMGPLLAKSPLDGALTSLYVATSPSIEEEGIQGKYFIPTAKLSKASDLAHDEELASKLWEFSEHLIEEKLSVKKEEEEKEEKISKKKHKKAKPS